MRLNSEMSKEEIRANLGQAALQSWGAERVDAQAKLLDQVAGALWTVMQVPLMPVSEEPDLPPTPEQYVREA